MPSISIDQINPGIPGYDETIVQPGDIEFVETKPEVNSDSDINWCTRFVDIAQVIFCNNLNRGMPSNTSGMLALKYADEFIQELKEYLSKNNYDK